MSLYRCAVCGSPNVVTDTQTAGVGYDYGKGLVGTLLFGSGGAAAGVRSKQQKVFKCPDCGQTLTYSMDEETKRAIDMGVMDADSRNKLRLLGVPVSWDFLKSKYRNIESGLADRIMASREEECAKIKQIGMTTKTESDEAIDEIVKFRQRMGLDGAEGGVKYSKKNLPKCTECQAYCDAVDLFVENFSRIFPDPSELMCNWSLKEMYRSKGIRSLRSLYADCVSDYICRKYIEEFGQVPSNDYLDLNEKDVRLKDYCEPNLKMFVTLDPALIEAVRVALGFIRPALQSSYEDSCKERDLWGMSQGFYSTTRLSGVERSSVIKRLNLGVNVSVPVLMRREGEFYYWDGSFAEPELNELDNYVSKEIDSLPSWVEPGVKKMMANYIEYYPDKKESIYKRIAEIDEVTRIFFAKEYDFFVAWHPIEE